MADDLLDDLVGFAELAVPVTLAAKETHVRMIETVVGDDVAFPVDAGDEVGVAAGVLADDEECGADVELGKGVEDRGR